MQTRSSKAQRWLTCKKRWTALTHDKCPNTYDPRQYNQCMQHTYYQAAVRDHDNIRARGILEDVSARSGGIIKEDRYFTDNPLTFGTVSAGNDVASKPPADRSYFTLLSKVLESNNKIIESINKLHESNTSPASQPGPDRYTRSQRQTNDDDHISS